LLCAALGLSWQLLTVHFNYGGNLTALFCHGSRRSRLPLLLVTPRVWLELTRKFWGFSEGWCRRVPRNQSPER
jgi:hypothetical protein